MKLWKKWWKHLKNGVTIYMVLDIFIIQLKLEQHQQVWSLSSGNLLSLILTTLKWYTFYIYSNSKCLHSFQSGNIIYETSEGFHYYLLSCDSHLEPHREQFPLLIIPTMLQIEVNQPWMRFMIYQSLTTTVVQIVPLSKSTLLPDEDMQYTVETLRSICNWLSCQTNDKQTLYTRHTMNEL